MLDRLLQRKVEYQLISACNRAFHRCECETTVVVFRDQVMIRAFLVPLDFPYRVGRNLLEKIMQLVNGDSNRHDSGERGLIHLDCGDGLHAVIRFDRRILSGGIRFINDRSHWYEVGWNVG